MFCDVQCLTSESTADMLQKLTRAMSSSAKTMRKPWQSEHSVPSTPCMMSAPGLRTAVKLLYVYTYYWILYNLNVKTLRLLINFYGIQEDSMISLTNVRCNYIFLKITIFICLGTINITLKMPFLMSLIKLTLGHRVLITKTIQ